MPKNHALNVPTGRIEGTNPENRRHGVLQDVGRVVGVAEQVHGQRMTAGTDLFKLHHQLGTSHRKLLMDVYAATCGVFPAGTIRLHPPIRDLGSRNGF